MSIEAAAAACAAAGLGYAGLAETIREESLSPQSIARLFSTGADKRRGYAAAVKACKCLLYHGCNARHLCREHLVEPKA